MAPNRTSIACSTFVLAFGLSACTGAATQGEGRATAQSGRVRAYFIAADEVTWDYVPGGVNGISGEPYKAIGFFRGGVKPTDPPVTRPVSTSYVKTLYREYTDASFSTLKPRAPEWEHLGFLGPLIRAEVGDSIRITFRNNGTRPYSMHPHGVFYRKDSEGAPYDDGTKGGDKGDDGVPPGKTHEYVWEVPERAGPAGMDFSSVLWMYHSHVHEVHDPNTGLMGPMIVSAHGKAKPDGAPADVDREFVTMFAQMHEEDSWYLEKNLPNIARDQPVAPFPPSQSIYPYFVTFSINGFAHGSMPLRALTARKGEHVRWYLFSGTNDFDAHTPHWHGNTVVANQMRTDVTWLAPMGMLVADMTPDNVGTWLLHCHISFHNEEGMNARYAVTE